MLPTIFSAGIGASDEFSRPSVSSVRSRSSGRTGPSRRPKSPNWRENERPYRRRTVAVVDLVEDVRVLFGHDAWLTWTSGEPFGLSLPSGPEESWMSQKAEADAQL